MAPHASIAAGGFGPGSLARMRAAFEARESELNAFIEPRFEAPIRWNEAPGAPLAGAAFALKDNYCLDGTGATCASRILEGFRPAYTATVVRRLLEAGAVCIGKTNMDEFAMGSSTEHSAYGPTRNPCDPTRTPGGSSGGSAVAVAAGMAAFALGSDTGGSVRQPAAFTGVVGFKPSYGRFSRYGLIAFASSLDHPALFTTCVRDAGLLYEVMVGADPLDATTLPTPAPLDPSLWAWDEPSKLRVGLFKQCRSESLDPAVRAAYEQTQARFRDAGATLIELDCPLLDQAVAVYYILAPAEASSNLARYDGIRYGATATGPQPSLADYYGRVRTVGFGPEVTRRILTGTFVLSAGYVEAYYGKAAQIRAKFQREYDAFFERVDVILTPTTPTPPFKIGEKTDDPVAMYLNDLFTIPANLAGSPALSLPVGSTPSGLPIGMQLMTRRLDEASLFKVGAWLERTRA